MKYKLAISGWDIVDVEADTPEEAAQKYWEEDLNALYFADIEEVVPADTPFIKYTDLN